MSTPHSMLSISAEAVPFLGRQSELARLDDAIRKRVSLLIWGASHSGKSALVARTLVNMPEKIRRRCICAHGNGAPQEILREIAEGLVDDPLFRSKFRADTGFGASFSHWVKAQTSLRLRGLLYRAAGAGEYWIFLDDLAPMTYMLARITKELMLNQETPIYAVAQGWTYNELGFASQLYWNEKQRLHVGGLTLPPRRNFWKHASGALGSIGTNSKVFARTSWNSLDCCRGRSFECALRLRIVIITTRAESRPSFCMWII